VDWEESEIFQLIESLNLIGGQTILTGIRLEVAMTAVQSGIDFSEIQTENSLKRGISNLSKKTKQQYKNIR
jgi:rsbT co-antagonist protein RsbR